MWTTSDYELIPALPTAHAALYRAASRFLSDEVGWDADDDADLVDIESFDRLTAGQKQLTILEVSRALLNPNVAQPIMTAARAATVDAIHWYLRDLIEFEIAAAEKTELRGLLLAAMHEQK